MILPEIMEPTLKKELVFLPLFIGFACLIKNTQSPFHSWLPGTIDSPTPVSALMHAGIVHAGGFILVRLYFLYEPGSMVSFIILIASSGWED